MKYLVFTLTMAIMLSSCGFQKSIEPLDKIENIKYPFATKKIELNNNIYIGYTDQGQGDEVLLFIHGLGSNMAAWKNNINVLNQNYRCIALDLPGYGKSSKGKYEGSMSYYSEIIQEFLQKLKIKKVTLIGHSMGGQISILTSLAFPDMVSKLILTAPAGFEEFDKGQKQWFREVFTTDLVKLTSVEAVKSNLGNNFYNLPDDALFMIKDRIEMRNAEDFDWYCYIIPENVKGMVNEPVFKYLKDIKQPVLTIFGKYDNLIPNAYLTGGKTETIARKGVEQMANGYLVLIDDAGHFVQFEKSEEFNKEVISFLKNNK